MVAEAKQADAPDCESGQVSSSLTSHPKDF